ncbi:hypothetical protein TRVA0_080S00188 [Trichomonascus vanleenenianus]|uniref:uncharacterized protein n=1 Tax=Trichomonascus vanleenenianus TaxID=2268995 RepID=UPI003ECAB351
MKFTTIAAISSVALASHDPQALFQYTSSMTEVLAQTSQMAQDDNINAKDVASKFICPVAGEVAKSIQDGLDDLDSDYPDGQTRGQMNRLVNGGKRLSNVVSSNNDLKCSELDDLNSAINKVQSKLGNSRKRSLFKRNNNDDNDDSDDNGSESDDSDNDMFDGTTDGVLSYGAYRGLNIIKNAGEQTAHDSGVTASKIQSSFTCPMMGEMANTIEQINLSGNSKKDQLSRKISGAATAVENTPSLGCDTEVKQLNSAVNDLGTSSPSSSGASSSSVIVASGGKSPETILETSARATRSASGTFTAGSPSSSATDSVVQSTKSSSPSHSSTSGSTSGSASSTAAEASGAENGANILSQKGAFLVIPAAALLFL